MVKVINELWPILVFDLVFVLIIGYSFWTVVKNYVFLLILFILEFIIQDLSHHAITLNSSKFASIYF